MLEYSLLRARRAKIAEFNKIFENFLLVLNVFKNGLNHIIWQCHMKKSRISILLVVCIIAILGVVYCSTDFFLSPSQKFVKELEYYEDLRYDTEYCSIRDYKEVQLDLFGDYYEITEEEVSIKRLRNLVAQESTSGEDGELMERYLLGVAEKWDLIDFDRTIPDISYDNDNLIIWVIDYSLLESGEITIYWWSPK